MSVKPYQSDDSSHFILPRQKVAELLWTDTCDDERFQGVPARWTFMAISNELDDFAKEEANQRGWPRNKVSDDADLNITVWLKTWAEVINDARARIGFVNRLLKNSRLLHFV